MLGPITPVQTAKLDLSVLCLGPGETDPSSPLQAAGQAMGPGRLLGWYIRARGRESGRNRT